MTRWIAATMLVFSACASDQGLLGKPTGADAPGPDILVEPSALTFGELSLAEEEIQSFTVTNVGYSTLHVSDVVIGAGLAFEVRGPETAFDLEPEESKVVDVAFSPMGADENFGQALVLSDDLDTPEAPVDLLGYGAVPELEITPSSYVFGDAFIPCGTSVELTLTNIGSEDLVISDLAYASAGMLILDDSDLRPDLPVTLKPGKNRTVLVTFLPLTEGADTGRLDVFSNDPRGVVSADQNGEGAYEDHAVEQFTEPGIPPVDVMMLIDHSGSMQGANTNDVETGMPDFVNTLQTVADWQLMQVTEENGCANGGNVITNTTPNAAQLLIDNAWNSDFGAPGYLTEALLELAALALDLTDVGECNHGFLRPGALLHIVVISDEPEQSGQSHLTWLGAYSGHVLSQDFVKVSAVVDINNNGCGNKGTGYIEAANASGGSLLDICNGNWGSNFSDIASDVLDGIRTYNLANPAVPETVVVTVNGVPTTDFNYSTAGNSVTINDPPISDGDLVEITYSVASTCN